ncbi:MAG: ferredoxin family protein [Alphaproteobacteria bacterium]|jgi:ferredoxin|nr:ferredoxin family protein [Alphaproteobacteria bacterium]MDP6515994.1 ferredoxin family protein [Alphaproteobacteria bacterium]|tara:strand:+ start:548 stop:886 length:339 start_codon:yes stop_codon:yes gene_type:complete
MTYVVIESCIKCKLMDCVEVCPVDCFYEGVNMLVIHPDECIDCGVCEPECPVEAILPDSEGDLDQWLKLNAEYAEKWPNITRKGEAPADSDDFRDVAGKFEKYFSPDPGDSG